MLLVVGVMNLVTGLVLAVFFPAYLSAGSVFSNGTNNVLMGLAFAAWGGVGLYAESQSRPATVLRAAFVLSLAVWWTVIVVGLIGLFSA